MDIAPFIEFMLDKILRTLKAKGEAYEVGKESRVKSRDKSRDKGSAGTDPILGACFDG